MAKSKQHETLLSTAADTAWLYPVREFCADHDLTLQVRGDNHIQIREDGAVILELLSVGVIRVGWRNVLDTVGIAVAAVLFVVYLIGVFLALVAVSFMPLLYAIHVAATSGGVLGVLALVIGTLHLIVMTGRYGVLKLTEKIATATIDALDPEHKL